MWQRSSGEHQTKKWLTQTVDRHLKSRGSEWLWLPGWLLSWCAPAQLGVHAPVAWWARTCAPPTNDGAALKCALPSRAGPPGSRYHRESKLYTPQKRGRSTTVVVRDSTAAETDLSPLRQLIAGVGGRRRVHVRAQVRRVVRAGIQQFWGSENTFRRRVTHPHRVGLSSEWSPQTRFLSDSRFFWSFFGCLMDSTGYGSLLI